MSGLVRSFALGLVVLAALPVTAQAETRLRTSWVPSGHRGPLPELDPGAFALYPQHVIYFNRYGGRYTETGYPDSRKNQNTIGEGTLTPFACTDDAWHFVMSCLKTGFGKYDVTVTDIDPGNTPHTETVVAGKPAEIGVSNGVLGIAPMGCGAPYENAVTFAFANVEGCSRNDLLNVCWAAAQETAHAFGLDHEVECADFMTYDFDCGYAKRFVETSSRCGEDDDYPPDQNPFSGEISGPRDCWCDGESTQNSHGMLTQIFGAKANSAPEIARLRPGDGDAVTPGFVVEAVVYDDRELASVTVFVDDVELGSRAALPIRFEAPASITEGQHVVRVVAVDAAGLSTELSATVTVQPPCRTTSECPGSDVCSTGSGQCVAGPGEPGGIGAECAASSQCDSRLCGDGPGGKRCTSLCAQGGTDCPDAFECLPAGDQGACWPTDAAINKATDDGGGCGCQVGGRDRTSGALAFALGALGLGSVLLRRRTRRARG